MNLNPEALESLYQACRAVLNIQVDEEITEIRVRQAVELAESKDNNCAGCDRSLIVPQHLDCYPGNLCAACQQKKETRRVNVIDYGL